jgi:signal transduction histidine kinase
MVTKGNLGVGYLVGVGVTFLFTLCLTVVPLGSHLSPHTTALGFSVGLLVASSFTLTGVGLAASRLDGTRVWRVAVWSGFGLGVPTLLVVLLFLWQPSVLGGMDWRGVIAVNIGAGGVIGALVGSLSSLRAEHERTRSLTQHNTVFLRLFRHDIRTSINIVRGHLDMLDVDSAPAADVIHEELDHVERLSDAANRLDDIESMSDAAPLAVGDLVRERVAELRRTVDDVCVEVNVQSEPPVEANGLLASAVDNLLQNAVTHSDGEPHLDVSVRQPPSLDETVELEIRDHGPGFSASELAVHGRETETALTHSDGVGLWLVRWIVDAFDGTVAVDNHEDGAVVTVRLPVADAAPGDPASTLASLRE